MSGIATVPEHEKDELRLLLNRVREGPTVPPPDNHLVSRSLPVNENSISSYSGDAALSVSVVERAPSMSPPVKHGMDIHADKENRPVTSISKSATTSVSPRNSPGKEPNVPNSLELPLENKVLSRNRPLGRLKMTRLGPPARVARNQPTRERSDEEPDASVMLGSALSSSVAHSFASSNESFMSNGSFVTANGSQRSESGDDKSLYNDFDAESSLSAFARDRTSSNNILSSLDTPDDPRPRELASAPVINRNTTTAVPNNDEQTDSGSLSTQVHHDGVILANRHIPIPTMQSSSSNTIPIDRQPAEIKPTRSQTIDPLLRRTWTSSTPSIPSRPPVRRAGTTVETVDHVSSVWTPANLRRTVSAPKAEQFATPAPTVPMQPLSQATPTVMTLADASHSALPRGTPASAAVHNPFPDATPTMKPPGDRLNPHNGVVQAPQNPVSTLSALNQPIPQLQPDWDNRQTAVSVDKTIVIRGIAYRRMECIGRGGSSKVYKIMNPADHKLYALKRVKLRGLDSSTVQGYRNEIELLDRLKGNPRIIHLHGYDFDANKQILSIVLEFGEQDLARLLARTPNPSMNFIRLYWEQILLSIQIIHQNSIIHSDLKPANFLLVHGQLKLCDFGIAKAIPNDTTNIQRDCQTGTLNYMAPEAIKAQSGGLTGRSWKMGRASDIWSAGCILYQLVYGRPPFAHLTNVVQKLQSIVDEEHVIHFPPPAFSGQGDSTVAESVITPEVWASHPLHSTLRACLHRDPKLRPTIPQLLSNEFLYPVSHPHVGHVVVDEEMLKTIISRVWNLRDTDPKADIDDVARNLCLSLRNGT
ncbi:kinase-like domain-containing protein [Gaertneriomyces semiglobifer]|nr:kinase-like domain-containing protein [Gaertneriomyces semiglobifer]